jgi:hypothetical protein
MSNLIMGVWDQQGRSKSDVVTDPQIVFHDYTEMA